MKIRKLVVSVILGITCACSSSPKQGGIKKNDPEFAPKLKKPEVRKLWVPDQIVGDEYISGHWKFVLEKNSVWTKEN